MAMTIGFIGGGNMAEAMVRGLIQSGIAPARVTVSEPAPARREVLAERYGVNVSGSNAAVAAGAEVLVLAVKPGVVESVLREVAPVLAPATLVISIAAGVTLDTLRQALPVGQPLVRTMPNTPALVGAGITVMVAAPGLDEGLRQRARTVLAAMGEVAMVEDEGLLDGVTALSGSGPAYVYLMAEALSDGGVACGLPRPLADQLAIHTLLGSARLLAASGEHPGVLKYQVTSPGGTTIAGLAVMEKAGVRGTLIETVRAAWARARELGGK